MSPFLDIGTAKRWSYRAGPVAGRVGHAMPSIILVILTKVRIQSREGQPFVTLDPDFRQDDGGNCVGAPASLANRASCSTRPNGNREKKNAETHASTI